MLRPEYENRSVNEGNVSKLCIQFNAIISNNYTKMCGIVTSGRTAVNHDRLQDAVFRKLLRLEMNLIENGNIFFFLFYQFGVS